MSEKNFFNEIIRLESIYIDMTKKIENEELSCYFAQDKVEELLRAEIKLKTFLKFMGVDKSLIEYLNKLINQTKQLSNDITNIIHIERSKYL